MTRSIESDDAWKDIASLWDFRDGVTYLNHGSFGPSARPIRDARRMWIDRLDSNPMDFYVREFEDQLEKAREILANFLGTTHPNLVFVENATFGMNIVADYFPLESGDEVLLNNHEYGAVMRIWNRACDRHGAKVVTAHLPTKLSSHSEIVEGIFAAATPKTKLIVVSHITSATAVTFPVQAICDEARRRGIAVCIDGPHAIAQLDVQLEKLGCDFYTASLHKWLAAPLGSGFLYVHPKWQDRIQPQLKSWGRIMPNLPKRWDEEFTWSGTRDPSPYLSVPVAIDFLKGIGIELFRARTHYLAQSARHRFEKLLRAEARVPDSIDWYGTMTEIPLPAGDWSQLQTELWKRYKIEIPIVQFEGEWFVRVSSYLYTTQKHFDLLEQGLTELLGLKK